MWGFLKNAFVTEIEQCKSSSCDAILKLLLMSAKSSTVKLLFLCSALCYAPENLLVTKPTYDNVISQVLFKTVRLERSFVVQLSAVYTHV